MPKYHKSPKTGGWTICKATADCPYGDIPEAARKALPRKFIQRSDLPVAEHLQLSEVRVDYETGSAEIVNLQQDTRVAPAGVDAFACPTCGTYIPKGYLDAFWSPNRIQNIPCPNPQCENQDLRSGECTVDVRQSELKYWEAAAVRQAHWFHITKSAHWLDEVRGEQEEDGEWIEYPQFVHVGSRESAMERLRDLRLEHRGSTSRYYLYEVALAPSTPVNPAVLADITDGWPQDIYVEPPEDLTPEGQARRKERGWSISPSVRRWNAQQCYQPDGVTAYVNAHEAPGTVSLIANPIKLVQVAREEIPAS